MARIVTLPRGIRVKNKKLMLDFSWQAKRYRVVTIYDDLAVNYSKADKLLQTIKLDLERGLFFISNYTSKLVSVNSLLELDANYEKNKKIVLVSDLLLEQLEIFNQRYVTRDVQYSTISLVKSSINKHLLPYFSSLYVHEVKSSHIEEFIAASKLTRKSLNAVFLPLNSAFKKAVKNDLIKTNPLDNYDRTILKQLNKSDYVVNPFSEEEIEKILNACNNETLKNIVLFGFWTGCRTNEILALKWENIDFKNETIFINASCAKDKTIKEPKTKAGIRYVEMLPEAKRALLSQYELTGKREFLFYNSANNLLQYESLRILWNKTLKLADVEYRNIYQMRHTFISKMLLLGNSPMILYRMIGHENPEMIYKHYAKFIKNNGIKLLHI